MSTGTIIAIVVVLVILAAVAAIASIVMRRRATDQTMSGPEYDRLANEMGPHKARTVLSRRRQRVDGLGLTSLTDERRAAYTGQWDGVQEQFIDNPVEAVNAAGSLVTAVAADRGYEVDDRDQFLTDLSVYHGRYLDGYRNATRVTGPAGTVSTGRISTEQLRQVLLDYRNIFFDLLETTSDGGVVSSPSADPAVTNSEMAASEPELEGSVPAQSPWKQVTQGLHWKTQRQQDDVTATRP